MPKCQKCGKKFTTLQALNDHFRAMHPSERFVAPRTSASRNLMIGLVIVIVAVGGVVGGLIYLQTRTPSTTTTGQLSILNQPINTSLYQSISGVSDATLRQVGAGSGVTYPPSPISAQPLTLNGKPEILYIGAEFCPLCGANRWPMVVALTKFGNFTNLEYMISSPTDGNVTTLSFRNANYSSPYLAFVSVENENRDHDALQNPTSSEQALWNEYNPNAYPFIDIGGSYTVTTEMYSYAVLNNLNWTQIAADLNNPSSPVAKAVDGSANYLISAFCKIDGMQPSSVCGQSFAQLTNLSYTPPPNGGSQAFQAIILPPRDQSRIAEYRL